MDEKERERERERERSNNFFEQVAIDKHYIKNHPQLHNPNWVRVGNVQCMFIYPIKGGDKMQHNSFRCNHNGMITRYSRSQVFWDGLV